MSKISSAPRIDRSASKTTRRALVVEDELLLRQHVVRLLERRGFEVDHTSEEASALRMLASQHYAVVVTDLLLPHGSGLEVVKHACERAEPPMVIVMTGYLSADAGRQALLAGASDFLEKPFTRERFFATVPRAS